MRIDEQIGRLTLNTFGLLGPPVHAVFPVYLRAAYLSARGHASGDEGSRLYNCEHLPSVVSPWRGRLTPDKSRYRKLIRYLE